MVLGSIDHPITHCQWQWLARGIILHAQKRPRPLSPVLLLTPSLSWGNAVINVGAHPNIKLDEESSSQIVGGFVHDFPARFLWEITQHLFHKVPTQSPFEPETMSWRWFDLLQHPPQRIAQSALMSWLTQQNAQGHWQLASSLAEVFHRYRLYADDMLESWSLETSSYRDSLNINHGEAWQKECWKAYLETLPSISDNAMLMNPLLAWVSVIEQGEEHPDYARINTLLQQLPFGQIHYFASEPLPPLYHRAFKSLASILDIVAWRFLPMVDVETMGVFQPAIQTLYGDIALMSNEKPPVNASSSLAYVQSLWAGAQTNHTPSFDDSLCLKTLLDPMAEVTSALHQLISWLHQKNDSLYTPSVALICCDGARYAPLIAAAVKALPEGILSFNWQTSIPLQAQRFFSRVMAVISGDNDWGGLHSLEAFAQVMLDEVLLEDAELGEGERSVIESWLKHSGWRIGSLEQLSSFPDAQDHGYERARERWLLGWFDKSAMLGDANIGAIDDTSQQQGAWLFSLIDVAESLFQWQKWAQEDHSLSIWMDKWTTLIKTLSPTHAQSWYPIHDFITEQHSAGMSTLIPLNLWITLMQEAIDRRLRLGEIHAYDSAGRTRGAVPIHWFSTESDNLTPHDYVLVLGLSASLYPSVVVRPVFDLLAHGNKPQPQFSRDHSAHKRKLVFLQWVQLARKGLWLSAPQSLPDSEGFTPPAQAFLAFKQWLTSWNIETDIQFSLPQYHVNTSTDVSASSNDTPPLETLWQIRAVPSELNFPPTIAWERLQQGTVNPIEVFLTTLNHAKRWRRKAYPFGPLTATSLKDFARQEATQNALITAWLSLMTTTKSVVEGVDLAIAHQCKRWVAQGQWPSGERGKGLSETLLKPWLMGLARGLSSSPSGIMPLPSSEGFAQREFHLTINAKRYYLNDWFSPASVTAQHSIVLFTKISQRGRYGNIKPLSPREVWKVYTRALFHQAHGCQGIWRYEAGDASFTYYPSIDPVTAEQHLKTLVAFWEESHLSLQAFLPELAHKILPLEKKKNGDGSNPEGDHEVKKETPMTERQWRSAYQHFLDPFTDTLPHDCWQAGWSVFSAQALVERQAQARALIDLLWQPAVTWWQSGERCFESSTPLPEVNLSYEEDEDE